MSPNTPIPIRPKRPDAEVGEQIRQRAWPLRMPGWRVLCSRAQKMNFAPNCKMRGRCAAPKCRKLLVLRQLGSPAELLTPP